MSTLRALERQGLRRLGVSSLSVMDNWPGLRPRSFFGRRLVGRKPMRLIFDYGRGVQCWLMDGEFYVYGLTNSGDPVVVPSEAMARAKAAAAY